MGELDDVQAPEGMQEFDVRKVIRGNARGADLAFAFGRFQKPGDLLGFPWFWPDVVDVDIDVIGAEALERSLEGNRHPLRRRIHPPFAVWPDLMAELAADDPLRAIAADGFADAALALRRCHTARRCRQS